MSNLGWHQAEMAQTFSHLTFSLRVFCWFNTKLQLLVVPSESSCSRNIDPHQQLLLMGSQPLVCGINHKRITKENHKRPGDVWDRTLIQQELPSRTFRSTKSEFLCTVSSPHCSGLPSDPTKSFGFYRQHPQRETFHCSQLQNSQCR